MLELDPRGVPTLLPGVHFLTEQEIIDQGFDNDEKPVLGLSAGELERLSEIALVMHDGGVDVWRDWENCLSAFPNHAWRELHELPCMLTVSTHGKVAHYDVNQPRNFDTLTELLITHVGDLSARERDLSTLVFLKRAVANVESALKAMPNHRDSVFDGFDVRRLDNIQRDIITLLMAEQDIER